MDSSAKVKKQVSGFWKHGYHKNWKNYCIAEMLLHSQEEIQKSTGSCWHTKLFRIKKYL